MDDKTLKSIIESLDRNFFKSQFEDFPEPQMKHLIWTSSHDIFVYYCQAHNLKRSEAFQLTWERISGLDGKDWKVVIPDDFAQIEIKIGTKKFLDLAYLVITRGFHFDDGTKESLSLYRDNRIKRLQEERELEERHNEKLYRKKGY